jgi:hypothetical protein
MSWHHAAHHKTKQAAKAHADRNLAHAPEHVKAAVAAAIDALPDAEGSITLETRGHIDQPHPADSKHWGESTFHLTLSHKPFPHDPA